MKEWRTIISSSLELRRNETQPCPLPSYDLLCSDRAVSLHLQAVSWSYPAPQLSSLIIDSVTAYSLILGSCYFL